MFNRISCARPEEHLSVDRGYANSKAVAIAWFVTYIFMVGGGLATRPAAKGTAEIVVQVADSIEQK